jgi:uncharacterized protein HemX
MEQNCMSKALGNKEALSDEQKLLRKLKRRTRFTQFLAWLALFFTAIGIAAGYSNWLRIHERSKDNQAKIEQINKAMPQYADKKQVATLQHEVNTNLTKNMEHLQGALSQLQNIQDSTQHIADSVYSQVKTLTLQQEKMTGDQPATMQNWSLNEVRFLLQTANQTFNLKNDSAGALSALNAADALLIKRGATKLLPLRKQISKDIASLSQYITPDIRSLSQQIDQLVDQLKPEKTTPNVIPSKEPVKQKTEDTANQPVNKESLVNRVKKSFNDAVTIRKFDKSLHDEMSEETKNSLFHLLSLRFETLRLMLLQERNDSYHRQLKRINELLQRYYSPEKIDRFKAGLEKLEKAELNPVKPDISGSLNLLESLSLSKQQIPKN